MKKMKYMELLLNALLESKDWLTADELAKKIGKSTRTIKTYVKTINENYEYVILSSKKGYQIEPSRLLEFPVGFALNEGKNIDRAFREQSILLCLLKKQCMNIYDLSIEIGVSENTIKSDIKRLNEKVEGHNIKIILKSSDVLIIGSEIDKNSFYIKQVYKNANNRDLTDLKISKMFKELDVDALSKILYKLLEKFGFFLDDFLKSNILFHLCLIIDTTKCSETHRNIVRETYKKNETIFLLSEELSLRINTLFSISLSNYEKNEIYLLLLSKQRTISSENSDFKQNIRKETVEIIDVFEEFMRKNHSVSIKKSEFLFALALHIDSLLTRIETKYYIRNPILNEIKVSAPFVYNIAVSLCEIINQKFSTRLSEDEIGFLCLHIENIFIDTYNNKKIKIGIFAQESQSVKVFIQRKLQSILKNNLSLITFFTNPNQVLEEASFFDFILGTSDLPIPQDKFFLKISPLLKPEDETNILKIIDLIRMDQKIKVFKNNLFEFTNEKFFMKNTVLETKNEVFEVVSNLLSNLAIVKPNFLFDLNYRENLSATSYNRIAIPHSFSMDAIKSQLYIIISEKPICWNEKDLVNIVFVFAINKRDKDDFYNIFEILSYIFSEETNINKFLKLSTYDEVMKFLCDYEYDKP